MENNSISQLIKFNEDLKKIADFILFTRDFDPKNAKETFLIYSLGKAYKTHSSILILCKNGYGQDSAILTRSLFELAVTTLYILKDSTDSRAERWVDYDWIRRNKMYEYMKSEDRFIELLRERSKDLKNDPVAKIKRVAQEMQKKHNYNRKLGWCDKNIFDMTKEVGLESLYPTVYKLHTEIHHSGVGAVNDYFSLGEDAIMADVGASPVWVEESLVSSFHFFSILVEKCNEFFKFSLDKKISSLLKKWIKQLGKK